MISTLLNYTADNLVLSASGTLDNVNGVGLSGGASSKLSVFVSGSGLQVSTVISKSSNGLY